MATIYRFIVEQKQSTGGNGRNPRSQNGKSTSKSAGFLSFIGGNKGGVEHNRRMRAINPLLNRMTGGVWEKGMRIGRAGIRLAENFSQKGIKGVLTGPAIAIIIAFVLQILMKQLSREQEKAQKQNAQNYKQLENGIGGITGAYKVTTNFWTGAITYNQNK